MSKLKLIFGKTETQWDALCKRCGWCCLLDDGKPCDHLVQLADGTTKCAIYRRRHNKKLRTGQRCVDIKDLVGTRARGWSVAINCGYGMFLLYMVNQRNNGHRVKVTT